jgi:hypothetical protein
MQAFHNDPAIKQLYIDRLECYAKDDELIQGTGWEQGKGCAVGCTLEAYRHNLYSTKLGILDEFAHLEDRISECLPNGQAMTFPLEFLQAFPVGMTEASQRMVLWRFKAWLLTPVADGGLAVVAEWSPDVIAAVERVRRLIDREIAGDVVDHDEWLVAERAAWSVNAASAMRTAWAVAWSAMEAAEAAAEKKSAAWVAAWVARATAWAAKANGEAEAWSRCREKLIELISEKH